MSNKTLSIIILAAGLGKRMKSQLPKVLHKVARIPMLVKIINESRKLNPNKIFIVVGSYKEIIENTIKEYTTLNNIIFVIQKKPLGTGDAVKSTLSILLNNSVNIILNGDTPLLKATTIHKIYNYFIKNNYKLQITAIELDNPTGNGRIIKNNGIFESIVEENDCNNLQKQIKLVNCGIYIATTTILKNYIPMITNNNIQHEYYLTDLVEIYLKNEVNTVGLYELSKNQNNEIININNKEQLESINMILSK